MKIPIYKALPEYSRIAKKYKQVKPAELKRLWKSYKEDGNELARNQMFQSLARLAFRISNQFEVDNPEDLVQQANLILLEAIDKYEERFENIEQYFGYAVYNGLMNYVNNDKAVKFPANIRYKINELMRTDSRPLEEIPLRDDAAFKNAFIYSNAASVYLDDNSELSDNIIDEETTGDVESVVAQAFQGLTEIQRTIIEDQWFNRIGRAELIKRYGEKAFAVEYANAMEIIAKKLGVRKTREALAKIKPLRPTTSNAGRTVERLYKCYLTAKDNPHVNDIYEFQSKLLPTLIESLEGEKKEMAELLFNKFLTPFEIQTTMMIGHNEYFRLRCTTLNALESKLGKKS